MRIILSLLLLSLVSLSFAQTTGNPKTPRFEAALVVDNDAFTLNIYLDQYYTSGIFGSFRHLVEKSKGYKLIRSYQINHRIYTPQNIVWRQEQSYDRPYAGMFSLSGGHEYYFPSNQYLKVYLELGWLGPGVRTEEIQTKWHEVLGIPAPLGWQYEINDMPIINLHSTYSIPFVHQKNVEVGSESNLSLGSVFNFTRQELILKVGNLQPLSQSTFYMGALGETVTPKARQGLREFYFFYSPGVEYVIYNSTIEGSPFGKKSPYTREAVPWIWQHRAGILFGWPTFDLSFTFYARKNETPKALHHTYVGIRLNQRF